jgi:ubiquinone/menaquinone biosynthesis C-methylase UbiE
MSSKNLNMKKYWENQSKHFLNTDQEGFGAVIYSGMPIWFNAFYDRYQIKSFTRLVGDLKLKDKKALDIGCGVGRWCFQLKRLGASATGIDFELERLKKARSNPNMKDIKFMNMSATNLSFKDESFHLSNSITVLHHIPYEEKKLAIKELSRVTKTGGYISIIELINTRDKAPHVYPWSIQRWQQEFENYGFRLIKKVGVEYAPIPRFLRFLKYRLGTPQDKIKRETSSVQLSKIEWLILRIAIAISYPLEAICVKFVPPQFAQQGGLLFIKE